MITSYRASCAKAVQSYADMLKYDKIYAKLRITWLSRPTEEIQVYVMVYKNYTHVEATIIAILSQHEWSDEIMSRADVE